MRVGVLWPKNPAGPITVSLQGWQGYVVLGGVLSRSYPTMVPESMAYFGTTVKGAFDFREPHASGPTDIRWPKQRTCDGRG